jgi:hypothetical protein
VDIVLPLLARDAERYLQLQRPTFERFYADLGTTWIVTPARDVDTLRDRVQHLSGVQLLDEDQLVPELPLVRRLGRGGQSISWYLQQLIKLAAVEQATSTFCLVLDADVVAVRPVSDADLVPDHRALRQRDPLSLHPDWVRNAGQALGVEPLDFTSAVTPSVLARDAVKLLADHADRELRPRKLHYRVLSEVPILRRRMTTWRARLLGVLPWTEYQLYDTFLIRTGNFDRFHRFSDDVVLYDNSVWEADEFEQWSPRDQHDRTYFFSVVQGWLDIPVSTVAQRLRDAGVLL